MPVVLFIDANQYLRLYGLVAGRKLLDSLDEQRGHIFVTAQIVDEVSRRKLGCAQTFFRDKLKEISATKALVPDLLPISADDRKKLLTIFEQAREAKKQIEQHAANTLSLISRSEDDVSRRLEALFAKAIQPNKDEMQQARDRKERGNPPGKVDDPLGDQITWEQFLSYCQREKVNRLWIITTDSDYCLTYGKLTLLNSRLVADLVQACGERPEINCFTDFVDGIEHFGKHAGVTAERLPSEEEAKEIKKEIDSLPPMGWSSSDDATMAVIRNYGWRQRHLIAATSAAQGWSRPGGIIIGLPDAAEPEKPDAAEPEK
jgi:hypothetical protein